MSYLDELLGLNPVPDRSDQIIITRQDLYAKIWSIPMTRLAKEFQISDVAIGKICKKLNVPKPPLGYWQKVRLGRHPRQLPLPEARPGDLTEATITLPKKRGQGARRDELLSRIAKESEPGSSIQVPAKPQNLHPLSRHAKELLKNTTEDQYGRIGKGKYSQCLEIHVSKGLIGRAIRIMDTLIKALEKRGHRVETTNEPPTSTRVIINQTRITVRLIEKIDRFENQNLDTEKPSWQRNRFTFKPTGRLIFEIQDYWSEGCRKKWTDEPGNPLEAQLNAIMIGLYDVAEAAHMVELLREKKEEQRRIQEAQRQQVEREKAEEAERIKDLEAKCDLWVKSQNLREFVRSFETELIKRRGAIDFESPEALWILWARGHADKIDPLIAGMRDKTMKSTSAE